MGRCKRQFHDEQQADDELAASAALIQALCAEGKHADARKEIETMRPLAARCQNVLTGLAFTLASAREMLASGQPELSGQQLDQILQEAHKRGLVALEFEARLTRAQLLKVTGQAAAARKEFASLAKAARAKGFGLIARKAAASGG